MSNSPQRVSTPWWQHAQGVVVATWGEETLGAKPSTVKTEKFSLNLCSEQLIYIRFSVTCLAKLSLTYIVANEI